MKPGGVAMDDSGESSTLPPAESWAMPSKCRADLPSGANNVAAAIRWQSHARGSAPFAGIFEFHRALPPEWGIKATRRPPRRGMRRNQHFRTRG